jgi:streptomycin 6-kinase
LSRGAYSVLHEEKIVMISIFETNILSIYKDKGHAWLKALPGIVGELSQRYGLSDLTPVSNLSYNYVLLGLQGDQPVVLKIGLDEAALRQEAAALRVFAGYGAVRVLAEDSGVLLLERAVPGDSLKASSLSSEEKIRISCQVMKRLHEAPFPGESEFSSMKEWLELLDKEWDMPPEYLHKARKLRDRLMRKSSQPVLLHGDLHHENILKHGKEWVVIDPKGVIGSPIHETWAFVMDVDKDPEFIAPYFGFNLQNVCDWHFVHLVLAIWWNLIDGVTPHLFLERAAQSYLLTSDK